MLLFTTTPASAITPMPDMTMTKAWPVSIMPSNAPIVAMTTQDSTRNTLVNLLNCASSTMKIRKIAAPKALPRKALASALSSFEPAKLPVDAGQAPSRRRPCATSACTAATWMR